MIRTRDRITNTIRRKLHLMTLAFLRPTPRRSRAAYMAGLRERESRRLEIERQKIAASVAQPEEAAQ